MNEASKKEKIIVVSVVSFIIIVFVLLSIFIIKKFFTIKAPDELPRITTTQPLSNTYDTLIEGFPDNHDSTALYYGDFYSLISNDEKNQIDYSKNYSFDVLLNTITFNFTCLNYSNNRCEEAGIKIGDNVIYSYNTNNIILPYILFTKDYIVIQSLNDFKNYGFVSIYDFKGNLLKKVENTIQNYTEDKSEIIKTIIKAKDNKLFIIRNKEKMTLEILSIDLKNNFKENIIRTFKAYSSEGEYE